MSSISKIPLRMSNTPSKEASTPLAEALRVLRNRAITLGIGGAVGLGFAVVLLAVMLFAWFDLMLDLPGVVRLMCGLAAIGGAIALTIGISFHSCIAATPINIAKRLDTVAETHGQIVAGVDLASTPVSRELLTTGLTQVAVKQAFDHVHRIEAAAVLPAKSLRRPIALFSLMLVSLAIIAVASPRMLAVQWLRFTDPFGDHPPYSALMFDVQPGDAKVIYGGTLDVRATVTGGVADRMDLVVTGEGAATEPLPMFPEADGKWRATLVNVVTPEKYVLRTGRARTRGFDVSVITVPKLTDVKFKVQLPAYTNRPPYEGPLPANGLSGLPGTFVEVHATSNRPLSGGQINYTIQSAATTAPASVETHAVAMTPTGSNSNEVVGRFQIQSSGKISLGVTDVAGQASTEAFTASVTTLKDERPFVRMIDPKPSSFATPDALIKVNALAEDDYGIAKAAIYRGLNESRPRPSDIAVPTPSPTQFQAGMDLNLADYGLTPGDTIELFARVADNDPAGGKGADSSIVTIRVVSQADMDRMTVAREGMDALLSKYAAAERRLEALDAKLDKLEKELLAQDPSSKLAAETKKKIDDLAKQIANAAAEIDKLGNHELPFDVDKALTGQLKELAKNLQDAADKAKEAGATGIGVAGALDKIKAVRKQLGKKREELQENAKAPLEHLARIYPLMEDQARYLDLYARQKDLADRMKSLSTAEAKDDPKIKAQMRDMEDEQRQLRGDLKQLLDDIDSHVAMLPDDHRLDQLRDTAKKFSTAVRNCEASNQMQGAETSLEEFAGTAATTSAQAAAETLSQFISRCQGMGNEAGTCMAFQPKLSQCIGNTVNQMLQSMSLSMGIGSSGTGGYSAVRNSLMNVGLYGTLPTRSQESASGGGEADHGGGVNSSGSAGDANADGTSQGKQHASGQSDAPVPAQYKKRVGEYFRRVSDEMSD